MIIQFSTIIFQTRACRWSKSRIQTEAFSIQQVFLLFWPPSPQLLQLLLEEMLQPPAPDLTGKMSCRHTVRFLFSFADKRAHLERAHRGACTAHQPIFFCRHDACSLLWLWDNSSRRNDWNTGWNFLFPGEASLGTVNQKKKKRGGLGGGGEKREVFERFYIIVVLPCVFFLVSYPRP